MEIETGSERQSASEKAEQLRRYQGKAETERQLALLRISGDRAADRRGREGEPHHDAA